MSPKAKRLIKWIGYPLFGLFVFVVMSYRLLPYERLKTLIEDSVAATGTMRLTIGELGPAPLLGLAATDITLRIDSSPPLRSRGLSSQAAAPAKKVVRRYRLDRLKVKASLLALLTGGVDLDFEADGLGGSVSGSFSQDKKKGTVLAVELRALDASQIAHIQLGPPLMGRISGQVKLSFPPRRVDRAEGMVELEVSGCSFGDGKAKLKVPGNAFMAAGITLPKVRLGTLKIHSTIQKGNVQIDELSASSQDVEIRTEGSVSLRRPLPYSVLRTYVRFKLASGIKSSSPAVGALEMAFSGGKRADGFHGVLIEGVLKAPKVKASRLGVGTKKLRKSGKGRMSSGSRRGRSGRRR